MDSIRLQKQLSEKNVALAVWQERFNNLNEVALSFPAFLYLKNAAQAGYSFYCCLPILSCQTCESQLEEVKAVSLWMSDGDAARPFVES